VTREAVAYLYGLTLYEVDKWPDDVAAVFTRVAETRLLRFDTTPLLPKGPPA
jgi:hypothetical protein